MKRFALLLTLALSMAGADNPDLAGKWELNVQQSTFAKGHTSLGMTLLVEHKGYGLHSKLVTVGGMEGGTVTEGDWYLDGQFHPIPGTDFSQMSKWDNGVLTAESESPYGTYEEHLKLTVAADGKRATEKRTVRNTEGTLSSTLIWDRQ